MYEPQVASLFGFSGDQLSELRGDFPQDHCRQVQHGGPDQGRHSGKSIGGDDDDDDDDGF